MANRHPMLPSLVADAIEATPGWRNLPIKEQIAVQATVAGYNAALTVVANDVLRVLTARMPEPR